MNSPLIHIGYPKTGTSWFQKNFYPFVQNTKYIQREEVQDQLIRPYAIGFDEDNAIQYFHHADGPRILICEELLLASVRSGGFNGFVIKEIGHRLKKVFPDAQIIIFIRNQIDLIASAYGQYIRNGGKSGIDQYLYHPNAKFYVNFSQFSFQYLEYDRILTFYRELFGDRIYPYLFEKFVNDNTGFLTRFSNIHKLEIDIKELDFQKVNKRLNITSYLRWRNRMRIPQRISFSNIAGGRLIHESIFTKRKSPAEILGKRNADYIRQYYVDSNRRLIDSFGMDEIRELGYPV